MVDLEAVRDAAGDLAVVAAGFEGGTLVGGDLPAEVDDVADIDTVFDQGYHERLAQQGADMVDVDGADAVDPARRAGSGAAGLQGGEVDVDEHLGVGPAAPGGRARSSRPGPGRGRGPVGVAGLVGAGLAGGLEAGVGEGGEEGFELGADLGEVADMEVPGPVPIGPGPAGPGAPDLPAAASGWALALVCAQRALGP